MPPKKSISFGASPAEKKSHGLGVSARTQRRAERARLHNLSVQQQPRKKPSMKSKGKSSKNGGISGGFSSITDKSLAGQEDVEYTTMVYETTSAFTSTGGATSYLQIKGNSIYRPYPSVLTSVAGYQRMYTQYLNSTVESATCEVRIWSGVTGQDEPFRVVVLPCTSAQYTVYAAYANVASLAGVPHAVQGSFSPGGVMPTLRAHGSNSTVAYGASRNDTRGETLSNNWLGVTGSDPAILWYFLVGYQNFAGTTTTNQQAQVKITYKVKWHRPIATAEQSIECDYFGNEHVTPEVIARLRALVPAQMESKSVERKFSSTSISIIDTKESKGEPSLKKAAEPSATQLGLETLEEDDDDEAEFLAYLKAKFKGRSQAKQAWVFENADFSGNRTIGSSST